MSAEPGGATSGSPVPEENVWRLATALSGAVAPSDVAEALAEEGGPAAGAAFSNMALLDPDTNHVRVVHGSVLSPRIAARWADFDLNDPTPLSEAMRTGEPVLLGSAEAIGERYPNLLDDTLAAALLATASLPLRTADGITLGAVGFAWEQPQAFPPAQRRRLELIAHMTAQALDRAMLSERERGQPTARERAEAHLLQEAFLPTALPDDAGLELAAAYLPARHAAVGGDWYDAFAVDGGLCLVIGDVAGHGLRSAAVMAQLRNAVRAFADEDPAPDRVLTRVNRMLCRQEPEETASAIVALWNPETATIVRTNAGHPPIFRCRRGESGFLFTASDGVLLGVDPDCRYTTEGKVLRPGTTLLFYTDGLVETRGRSIEAGMDDLRSFIEGLDDLSPQVLCDRVLDWRLGAAYREDDMCLLAARLG